MTDPGSNHDNDGVVLEVEEVKVPEGFSRSSPVFLYRSNVLFISVFIIISIIACLPNCAACCSIVTGVQMSSAEEA